MRKLRMLLMVLAGLGLSAVAWAGPVSCGCYCGVQVPPPCSDDACKSACGWQEPAAVQSSYVDNTVYTQPAPAVDPQAQLAAEKAAKEAEARRLADEKQRQFLA